jgi:hypothetical protein
MGDGEGGDTVAAAIQTVLRSGGVGKREKGEMETRGFRIRLYSSVMCLTNEYKRLVKVNSGALYVSWCQVQTKEYNVYSSASDTNEYILK